MSEIVSLESQEPVCFTKLEPEDVTYFIALFSLAILLILSLTLGYSPLECCD